MKEKDLSLVIDTLNNNKHRLHRNVLFKFYSLNKEKQFISLDGDGNFPIKDLYFENHAFTLCNILKIIYPSISAVNLTYSMFGLGINGIVYRYGAQCEGWIPWPNKIADCRLKHPNKK